MGLEFSPCEYHKNRTAVTRCERCNRLICLEDKKVYNERHTSSRSTGVGSNRRRYSTTHFINRDLCIPCYEARTLSDTQTSGGEIVGYIFVAVWTLISLGIFFPLAFFSIFIVYSISNQKQKNKQRHEEAKQELLRFNKGLATGSNPPMKESSRNINCFQCGYKLELGDKFCPNCGDSTKEELEK